MKKNMLIRIVSLLCVLTCLFAFASCHDDLATKEEVNNAQNTAKTDLTEAQKALYEAMDAVKATADAAATKAALEEVAAKLETVTGTADAAATQAALEEALAKLTEVETTANAAATNVALEEAKTALNAAIEAVKTTADAAATKTALEDAVKAANDANTALKDELDKKIADNTTLIGEKATELQAAIDALADTAATKEALNKVVADLAGVKATADAAATKAALDEAVATLNAVKATADAAATQVALDKVIADLEALETSSATGAALDEVIADLEALETAAATKVELAEVSALLATVKGTADAAATKTALEAAEKALNDALDAAKKDIATNASDIVAIKNTLATLATVENLNNVNAELANVKAIAEAAQTEAEVEAAITAAIKDLKLDDKLATLKSDLQKEIADLGTEVKASIKTNADDIAAIKTEISNLKLSVGDKTEVTNLATRVAKLEEDLAKIDVDAFKNAYVALTNKLLSADYEYAYSKFVAIVLDIDEGPYDPDEAKAVRLRAEDILFAVTRAVSEDGLKELYDELVEIKANLKTLEESLRAKVDAITSINTTAESIQAVKDADKIYEKMVALEIAFEDPSLKDEYLDIWNAYIELNGGTTKDETVSYDGYKNIAKKDIDDIVAKILGRDVKLAGTTDKDIIDAYQTAITNLKTSIENSTHRDLYEAGLAAEVIAAVKAEVIDEDIADMTAANFETYKGDYRTIYVASVLEGFVASAKEAINTEITTKKGELMAADDTLSEDDALAQATTEVLGTYASIDEKAQADGEAAANADADTKVADFEASANAQIAAEANAYAESDAGKLEIYVRAMAESLYNEDAAEAVAERYENMVQAAADAADLVNDVITIIGNWNTTGLLWDDTTAADAVAKVVAWVADTKYQSTNEAYIAAYAFCDDTITDANRDYVFGNYNGSTTNYKQITNVKGYVEALKSVYDSYDFADVDADGVEAFIVVLKNAINGTEVDGKIVLDVDDVAVDNCKKAITALDAAIKAAANNNAVATTLNQKAMVGDIARNRITVIETAEGKLGAIITELKTLYFKDGAWSVTDINAADTLDAFRARIDVVYAEVQADSTAPDYIIYNVTSSLAEDALNGAIASFNKYTEFAAQKYLEAKELIDELEALGAVKLNHGKRIYEVSVALKSLSTVITGMTYETRFPVDVDGDGTFEMVDFYDLQEKINNKYVPDYKALATEAEAKAAELEAAITALVAKVGDKANKLDYYNEIVALMDKVEAEWLNYFYSDEMLAKAGATDDEVMAAIAGAVAATTDTKIIGGKGTTYAFLTSEAFAKLETITKTANATYATAKGLAEQWIKDAIAIVNGGSYTFHEWDKAGNNFKNIEERYNAIIATYYVVFDDTTDPDFGLYAAHETFNVEYAKCKKMAEEAAAQIKAIEDAIEALGALNTITLDNTVEKRAAVDAIKAAITAFEVGYCDKAQEDGDIDADLLFTLAKYDGMVSVAEYWVSKKTDWPATWNAVESFNVSIEAIDSSIEEAAEFGIDRYTALNNFINNDKSTVDKEISNAATANP